jgi:hypothetical protein
LLPFSSLFPKIYHFSLLELLFKNTFDDIPHLGGGGEGQCTECAPSMCTLLGNFSCFCTFL